MQTIIDSQPDYGGMGLGDRSNGFYSGELNLENLNLKNVIILLDSDAEHSIQRLELKSIGNSIIGDLNLPFFSITNGNGIPDAWESRVVLVQGSYLEDSFRQNTIIIGGKLLIMVIDSIDEPGIPLFHLFNGSISSVVVNAESLL